MLDRLRFLLPVLAAALVSACAVETAEDVSDDAEEALSGYEPPAAYAEGKLHSDLTGEIVENLRAIHSRSTGRDRSFIKVGDSITFSTSFLRCLARTPAQPEA